MKLEEMYYKAYNEKKKAQGVYSMNDYCSNVEEQSNVNDIPDIMKLYYDKVITPAQNEFITNVLDKIVLDNPESAIEKIIKNIKTLEEEEALGCVSELLLIFIDWNEDITDIFLVELLKAKAENSRYFIESLKYQVNAKNDEFYRDFLRRYYEELGRI